MCARPFETRSLPSSLAATHRGFAFYVDDRVTSFDISALPIYVARIPAAPFTRRCPRDFTFYLGNPLPRFVVNEVAQGIVQGNTARSPQC
jgi:hypothetical protein